jgi:hypothetical protein
VRRDPTVIKLFDAAQLILFESLRIAVYVTDNSNPPNKRAVNAYGALGLRLTPREAATARLDAHG